ncbi:hypothetical protein [Streptomyces zhihengii]|uniref:MuF-like minor capsid protein n=1 Tax=Streptomyces zhihengii TaxID=1818004 RepID=A0ABS2UTX2_9ACTN|nr:hypothetical protein [Streptomyces zhihengii]MBM9621021.1 hypothetical protein [Streptomyces zhihengii]
MSGPSPQARRWSAEHQALALSLVLRADALWSQVDPRRIGASWRRISAQLTAMLIAAQQASAEGAQAYVAAVVAATGEQSREEGSLNAAAFAGWAADGRSLSSLLELPSITTLTEIAAGLPEEAALQRGRMQLQRIVATEVADAGRSAVGASIVSNRTCTGYVRVVAPGACGRCVVLAGNVYGSAIAFRRHPLCHCIHEPTTLGRRGALVNPRQYFDSLTERQQNRAFTVAGARAIRDGADISSVVNARRRGAVYTATAYGRQVRATREGTTRRGLFTYQERARAIARGQVPASGRGFRLRTPRLLPEEIYDLAAGDRDEAIRMLRRFAYIR